MTDDAPATPIAAARDHATQSWTLFADNRGLKAGLSDWQTSTAPDGNPVLSAEVVGGNPARALALFAAQYYLILPHPGDLRPRIDISVPGRTVLVWRRVGVWVQLWHPDTVQAAPEPVQDIPEADVALVSTLSGQPLLGPGGRLTFTRRNKETTTA